MIFQKITTFERVPVIPRLEVSEKGREMDWGSARIMIPAGPRKKRGHTPRIARLCAWGP